MTQLRTGSQAVARIADRIGPTAPQQTI